MPSGVRIPLPAPTLNTESMKIKIKQFDNNYPLPSGEDGAACFDFICRKSVTIPPRAIKAVPQNVAVKVPKGHVLLLFSRSSTPHKKGLALSLGVGVIDPFYCGDQDEIYAFMQNITDKPVTVEAGDRIVQGMILKTQDVQWQQVNTMGEAGHGGYRHSDGLDI